MTSTDPQPPVPASADARLIADSIQSGWIGRGFKLGLGFFLAALVVWMIPMLLLASCVAGMAGLAGAAALNHAGEIAEAFGDAEMESGTTISVTPPAPADQADAAAAAQAAAADSGT